MKEHPILFSAPMVRGILENRKTQTRRIVKPQPEQFGSMIRMEVKGHGITANPSLANVWGGVCPYGQPGDRLWVRETFYCDDFRYPRGPVEEMRKLMYYRADVPSGRFEDADEWGEPGSHWKSSIHMPRWASRITLEITDVRVQRLQDISEDDAIAEGCQRNDGPRGAPIGQFRELWNSINGNWDANTWVWCVSFRRAS